MGSLWFPREEYQARLELLREHLDERNLDAMLVTWDQNIRYYAGFRQTTANMSPARTTTLLMPRKSSPVLFVHVFQSADARASTWFEDVRAYQQLSGPPLEDIVAEIRARDIRRLAVELGEEMRVGMPAADFLAIRDRLSGVEWLDAADLIWQQRIRKSPAEQEWMRKAGHATAQGYHLGFPRVKVGMTEREVAGVLQAAMLEGGAEQIAFILLSSGEGNYGRISGYATNRRVQKGEMVWVDMGARVNDYCADFTRAAVLGGPTDQQKRMQEIVVAVTAKGVEVAGPGVPIAEIVKACNEEMRRRGQENTFVAGRIGHGVGLSNTEPPHVALYDKTVLEPGMTIAVEPGIVERYGAFHCEENLIITENGREIISTANRSLWSI